MNVSAGPNALGPFMIEADQIFLKAKGASRPLTFTQAFTRYVRYLVSVTGDKSIDDYLRA